MKRALGRTEGKLSPFMSVLAGGFLRRRVNGNAVHVRMCSSHDFQYENPHKRLL